MLFHLSQANKLTLNITQAKVEIITVACTGILLKMAMLAFDNLNQDHKKYYDEHCQHQWDCLICPAKYAMIKTGNIVTDVLQLSGGVLGICAVLGFTKIAAGIYKAKKI